MPIARPTEGARNEGGRMKHMALCVVALMLSGWLVAAPATAQDCLNCTNIQIFAQPAPPPAVAYPAAPYYYPYPPYYPPPAFHQGSWWDPDYRDIRYNRYFQRYQAEPQVRGFTLR